MMLRMMVMPSTRSFNLNRGVTHYILMVVIRDRLRPWGEVVVDLVAQSDVVSFSLLSYVMIPFKKGLVLLLHLLFGYLLLKICWARVLLVQLRWGCCGLRPKWLLHIVDFFLKWNRNHSLRWYRSLRHLHNHGYVLFLGKITGFLTGCYQLFIKIILSPSITLTAPRFW